VDKKYLDDFLELEFKMDTLNTVGFENFIFLSINPNPENPRNISLERIQVIPNSCKEFIVAIDKKSKSLYRLKGFVYNDFLVFMDFLKALGYLFLSSSRKFIKNYQVSQLDLEYLYSAFKPNRLRMSRYSCLRNCSQIYTTH
jgi:hypothetical protein